MQVRTRFNILPSKHDFELIEEFARENKLGYEPTSLIFDWDDDISDDSELFDYLQEYDNRLFSGD